MRTDGSMSFTLPSDAWVLATAEETVAAGAAYLAYRPGGSDWFATNLTVTGQVVERSVDLASLADGAMEQLRSPGNRVELERRESYGSPSAPGLIQLVDFTLDDAGVQRELQQCQVLVLAPDVGERSDQESAPALLYLVSLTGPPDEVRTAAPDLQRFLRSIELEDSPAASE